MRRLQGWNLCQRISTDLVVIPRVLMQFCWPQRFEISDLDWHVDKVVCPEEKLINCYIKLVKHHLV